MNKLFQLSCPIFWGFNRNIAISNKNTMQECIEEILDLLESHLFEQNLIDLLNFLKSVRKEYHIHDHTLESIKKSKGDTIYICRHSSKDDDFLH